MTQTQLQSLLTELRSRLAELYGERLALVGLYGSYARGEAEEESDIDVLVLLHGRANAYEEIERCGAIISEICLENNVLIACSFMSLEEYERGEGPFIRNLHRDLIVV